MPARLHGEIHRTDRIGWLRAAVLGAQDGVASTASLLIGVAAANSDRNALIIAGVAALVAGALSMAAGEYTSVSSQRDTEMADIARESAELQEYPDTELEELTQIYEHRGLDRPLARQVAIQLTKTDALGSHVRDELGIAGTGGARPLQAALVSAGGFVVGALPPVVLAAMVPSGARILVIAGAALVLLASIGAVGARLGGAQVGRAPRRVSCSSVGSRWRSRPASARSSARSSSPPAPRGPSRDGAISYGTRSQWAARWPARSPRGSTATPSRPSHSASSASSAASSSATSGGADDSSLNAARTRSTEDCRSAFRSTRATNRSPRRKGRT